MTASPGAPPEPSRGQDDAPDVLTAIRAVLRVFAEILDGPGQLDAEQLNRIAALRRALARLRTDME